MLSGFSVKKPYTVLVGVVLVIVLGIVSFTRMSTDLLPSISLPYVIVMTTYPGAGPETVETAVTKPVEASMATVSNIESISSVSSENYSMVILEFSQSADMNSVSLEIRENLDQITSYWDDSIGNPIIMKMNPDMLPVLICAVGVDGMDHAQLSDYVENTVASELESLEGVASVSASGLLEESINVIIRQEKVDAINEKVYAAIDEKLQEALDELEDGRQQIEDGWSELESGRKELVNGQKELEEGKAQLEDGKAQLDAQKEDTLQQLANTKKDLLTAKTDLEAMKIVLTTNIATASQLEQSINELLGQLDQAVAVNGQQAIDAVTVPEVSNISGTVSGSDIINGMIDGVNSGLQNVQTEVQKQLTQQLDALRTRMKDLTGGLSAEEYTKQMNEAIASIDTQLGLVNSGLVELEKGELTAAIEFADAAARISLGEYQMSLAQTQLDAAREQLTAAEEQLEDAEEQLEEGLQQLEEGRQEAYDQADMTEIVSVDMVKALLTAQNFSMPAGYVTEKGVEYLVRVGDKPATLEDLESLPLLDLHMDGVPVITLGDVADVFYADNSAEIYTNVNGSVGCMLTIQKQTGYSTGDVSDRLAERFEQMMSENPDLSIITLMDQGIYIDLVMDSIFNNVFFGFLLSVLILILFLKDWKPTLVIACSIPISLVTAIVCMYFSGVTLNVISLSGLALGIGMLVDNSIVVIENIYRMRSEGRSMLEASVEGAKEVAGAIVASTLTTVCVFAPIVFTEGITRQLFVDMGLTIGYSLLGSLIVALTVVPAMSSKVLTNTKEKKQGKFFNGLVKGYMKLLDSALHVKSLVIVIVIAMLVISIAGAWTNGTAFMPDMDSTQMTVYVTMPDDALLSETAEVTDQVVERLLAMEDVENAGAMASGSSMSMLTGAGNSSNNATIVYVTTKEDRESSNEELAAAIIECTEDLTGLGAQISVDSSSMDMSAMGGSGISIQVRGRDLDTLRQVAGEVAAIVESVEGVTDVSDGLEDSGEELRITVNKEKAMEYGLTVAQVFSQIYPKLAAASTASVLEASEKDYNIYIEDETNIALTRQLVKELTLEGTNEEGEAVEVPLSDIAVFSDEAALNSISRADQTRYVTVSAALEDGYNIGRVSVALERKMADYQVPDGCSLVYSGENETINDAMEQVLLMLLLAVVFMYLIMVAQFQSLKSPFIIMFTIPLAFTGGFLGLFFSGSEISVIAMIGFVMLSGIIVNNGIVLVDYINQLRQRGMEKRAAILEAGRTRLRPVLMTALTTILSLSTMVFSQDMGSAMAKPMAIVTIGGLVYGTLLTLVVIPCIYDIFNREKGKKKKGLILK